MWQCPLPLFFTLVYPATHCGGRASLSPGSHYSVPKPCLARIAGKLSARTMALVPELRARRGPRAHP